MSDPSRLCQSARARRARPASKNVIAAAAERWHRVNIESLERRLLLATVVWDGGPTGTGTNWNDAANWAGDVKPGATDDAVINTAGVAIAINGSQTVRSITASRVISIGGSLIVNGELRTTANINLLGGAISNATVHVAAGAVLAATGGALSGVTFNGDMAVQGKLYIANGLTLNGTARLGDDPATYYGSFVFDGTQTLRGNGTVIFGGYTNGYIFNTIQMAAGQTTLTIAPNITVRGRYGGFGYTIPIGGPYEMGLVNQGTIQSDAGGLLTFTLANFRNEGALNALNGGQLGFSTVDNSAGTVTVDATSKLSLGSTFTGGVITTRPGAAIAGATLSGVTINGDFNVSGKLTVANGLTLNGTAYLGDAAGTYYGSLVFDGSQTLGGNGTVVFGSYYNGYFFNTLQMTTSGTTLTIGPGVTVRGDKGVLGYSNPVGGAYNVNFINHGTIRSDVNGGIVSILTDGVLQNDGRLAMTNGGVLGLNSRLVLNDPGWIEIARNAAFTVPGGVTGDTRNSSLFRADGTLNLTALGTAASPALFEVMGRDAGATAAGFKSNFALGTLQFSDGGYAKLVDQFDNAPGAPDATYVDRLIVAANVTLDLNGQRLYARATQINGTLINGTVVMLPDGGPVNLASPVSGRIAVANEVDAYTFVGQAGRTVSMLLNPGPTASSTLPGALTPALQWGSLSLVAPNGAVLATASGTTAGQLVALTDVTLPTAGTYTLRVSAASGHASSTGNYGVAVYDVTSDAAPLLLNQAATGAIETPFASDRWNLSLAAGQQVRFDWLASSSNAIQFSLVGPGGYEVFTNLTADSDLITIPADKAGAYVLTAKATADQTGGYTFALRQTAVTPLAPNGTASGTLAGSGDARLFKVTSTVAKSLLLRLDDSTNADVNELYVRHGLPPTRTEYDYGYSKAGAADQSVLVPNATPGDWYVLVYANTAAAASAFTLDAAQSSVFVFASSTAQAGANIGVKTTVTGAGFVAGSTVALVDAANQVVATGTADVDSFTQITATFDLRYVPVGVYGLRVTLPGGETDRLAKAMTVLPAGVGKLETRLIMPSALGRHANATIYVEYANTGNAPIAAPLIRLQSADADNSDRPLLTLDQSKVVSGFWTSAIPDGFSNSVQILGSGASPGVLNPGERVRVPVYYSGLQQPWNFTDGQVEMELRIFDSANADAVPWADLKAGLKPRTIRQDAWDAIYGNLVANVGSTWGAFVSMLSENAQFIARLGQQQWSKALFEGSSASNGNVLDVGELWSFEIQQAIGFSPVRTLASSVDAAMTTAGSDLSFGRSYSLAIDQRFETSIFGRGWSAPWQTYLAVDTDGSVNIYGSGGSRRRFQPDSRSANGFFAATGDSGVLSKVSNGVYEVRESDGSVVRFNADGRIGYTQDANGNRITAGYGGGRLTGLTHSAGGALSIAYNGAGLVSSITDSAGRVTTYAYDPTNTFLMSVATPDGLTTSYTYDTTPGSPRQYALTSVTAGGVTQNFGYDSRGRLLSSNTNGNTARVDFAYDTAGEVRVTDAANGTTRLAYDQRGLLTKVIDPFGNVTTTQYGADLRVSKIIDPLGQSQAFTWCACGSMTSSTDQLGHSTNFTYDWVGPNKTVRRMTSFTDARGNTTKYTYDAKGNLLKTIYPNNSVEQTAAYDPTGNPLSFINRRGQTLGYTYNAAGQVTRQTFNDGTFIDLAYDARGNLKTVTEPGSKITTYDYAAADRLTKVTYPQGRWLAFTYDAAGRRATMTDQLGYVVRYAYDAAGRLFKLTDTDNTLIVQYSYDPAGRLSRKDNGNNTFTTYAYDVAGQVLSIVNRAPLASGGHVNSRFDYTYDAVGRRTTMTTVDGQWTYGYDATGQLTSAIFVPVAGSAVPAQALQYVYDAVGNRVRTIENGVTTAYTTNNLNQYTQVGGDALTYDADGNLTGRSGPSSASIYMYDELNRLTRSIVAGMESVNAYNVFGERVATSAQSGRTEFVVDPLATNSVVGDYSASGTLDIRYVHGAGLVSRQGPNAGAMSWYDFDANGSTANLTSDAGAVVSAVAYLPFGELVSGSAVTDERYLFVGEIGGATQANGLYKMGARDFSASLGRFVSEDPLGIAGGDTTLTQYVGNDPINFVDPAGTRRLRKSDIDKFFDYGDKTGNIDDYSEAARDLIKGTCREKAAAGGNIMFGKAGTVLLGGFGQSLGFSWGIRRPLRNPMRSAAAGRFAGEALGKSLGGGFGEWLGGRLGDLFCNPEPPKPTPPGPGGGAPGGDGGSGTSQSQDPNELYGPAGFGNQHFIATAAALPYTIEFENYGPGSKEHDGTPAPASRWATAPAQRVEITNALPPQLDLNTVALTGFGFGDTNIAIPGGVQYFAQTVAMTYNGKTFEVLFEANLNRTDRTLAVTFQSLDPATLLPPDVLTGFLPPEDGTGRGRGFVTYVAKAAAGLVTGTAIRNIALITFDGQTAITTNQVDPLDPSLGTDPAKEALVTLDAAGPASSVQALPAVSTSNGFTVSWTGTDDAGGSGVGNYDIYVSDNGGAFTRWLAGTTDTQAAFTGVSGHTYSFYSVARDNVGHVQPTPTAAQATTQLIAPTAGVVVDDGTPQRSMVRSLVVTLGTPAVSVMPAGAFVLTTAAGVVVPTFVQSVSAELGKVIVTLGFSDATLPGGSLRDGRYMLAVDGSRLIDAAGNGVAGSVYRMNFHRLFGDVDGDGGVSIIDFNAFTPAFGKVQGQAGYVDAFDYDDDNGISVIDFNELSPRFGRVV